MRALCLSVRWTLYQTISPEAAGEEADPVLIEEGDLDPMAKPKSLPGSSFTTMSGPERFTGVQMPISSS